MSSGVQLAANVKEEYQKVKTGKKNPYVIFKLSDDLKSIVVERVGEEGETFGDFRDKMMEAGGAGQGRYAVYDMTEDQDGGSKHKTGTLVFIAMSGLSVDPAVVDLYKEMKTNKDIPYIIFKISADNKHIEIEEKADEGANFDKFKETMDKALKDGEGRYAVYDVIRPEYQSTGSKSSRTGDLLFIMAVSDSARVKAKMLLSSSKDYLKKQLVGVKKELTINDPNDLTMEAIMEKIKG